MYLISLLKLRDAGGNHQQVTRTCPLCAFRVELHWRTINAPGAAEGVVKVIHEFGWRNGSRLATSAAKFTRWECSSSCSRRLPSWRHR